MSRKRIVITVLSLGVCVWALWVWSTLRQVGDSISEFQLSSPQSSEVSERAIEDASVARGNDIVADNVEPERADLPQLAEDDSYEPPVPTQVLSISLECEVSRNAIAQGDYLGSIDQPEFEVAQQLASRSYQGLEHPSDVYDQVRENYILAAQDGNTVAVNQLAFFYRNQMEDLVKSRAWDIVEHSMRHSSLDNYREMPGSETMTEEEKAESRLLADAYMSEYQLSFDLIQEMAERACE